MHKVLQTSASEQGSQLLWRGKQVPVTITGLLDLFAALGDKEEVGHVMLAVRGVAPGQQDELVTVKRQPTETVYPLAVAEAVALPHSPGRALAWTES